MPGRRHKGILPLGVLCVVEGRVKFLYTDNKVKEGACMRLCACTLLSAFAGRVHLSRFFFSLDFYSPMPCFRHPEVKWHTRIWRRV